MWCAQKLAASLAAPAKAAAPRRGLDRYRDSSMFLSATKGRWQVVEVREGKEPGQFTLFAFVAERKLRVRVGPAACWGGRLRL